LDFKIRGEPFPFATDGEKKWKKILEAQLPQAANNNEIGVNLKFIYNSSHHKGPADLDNLCEPVFSILVNRKGWFRGKRPNIIWWNAKKIQGNVQNGCEIELIDDDMDFTIDKNNVVFDEIYTGNLPTSGADSTFFNWVMGHENEKIIDSQNCQVTILFEKLNINLGDIATGPIKSIIDCLFPILGGSPSKPHDHKVSCIRVKKQVKNLILNSVRIVVEKSEVNSSQL